MFVCHASAPAGPETPSHYCDSSPNVEGVEWLTRANVDRDPEQAAQVHRVVAAVAALGGAVGWLTVPDRAESDAWLHSVLDSPARLGVVRVGGRIEALGYWVRLAADVLARNAEIRKVMVHPEARGLGLSRTLMRGLLDDATEADIETVILDVRGNNHGALRLYESLGFEEYGRLPDFIAVDEHRFDRVLLRKGLSVPVDVVRHGDRAEGPGASLTGSRSTTDDTSRSTMAGRPGT
jgi:ribosomal protein S18 acetylase RimI-like enzyme